MGLSIATLLSQNHEVMAVDIIPEKVEYSGSVSPDRWLSPHRLAALPHRNIQCKEDLWNAVIKSEKSFDEILKFINKRELIIMEVHI